MDNINFKSEEKTTFDEITKIKSITFYPNVTVGKNVEIETNSIIGYPPIGFKPGELKVEIGDNSRIMTSAVIYGGNVFGQNTLMGHRVYIREKNEFGDNCQLGTNTEIEGYSKFGNHVKLHTRVHVGQYSVLKNKIFIAPGTILTNDPHPPCGKCLKGPTIHDYVAIGANVTISPRIIIGTKAIVGAGAVVTKNVEPKTIVAGVPAKKIATINDLVCDVGIIKNMPDDIYKSF
jgi:acetyltransferase-like isoleucine patch superfamily enzyme